MRARTRRREAVTARRSEPSLMDVGTSWIGGNGWPKEEVGPPGNNRPRPLGTPPRYGGKRSGLMRRPGSALQGVLTESQHFDDGPSRSHAEERRALQSGRHRRTPQNRMGSPSN